MDPLSHPSGLFAGHLVAIEPGGAGHWSLMLFLLVAAPAVGSFLGTVADRAAVGGSALVGRSRCDGCGTRLAPRDLMPVLSWAASGGRARCCGAPLRAWLPGVEIAAFGITAWGLWATAGAAPVLQLATCLLGWTLLGLALVDLRTFRLPDAGTLPLLLAGLGLSAAGLTGPLSAHLAGAALGYGALAGIGWAYLRLRGIDGLGLGDAKLLAAGGAWLGWTGLPSALLWASLAGVALAVATGPFAARRAIPFGPGIAAGIWLTWLYGPLVFG